jgi:hypothetical protein
MRYPDPIRQRDFLIATIAGLLAWVITFALKMALSG